MIRYPKTDLNSMWDMIDQRRKKETETEETLWGKQYLEQLIEELIESKIKAKKENNPLLYHQLTTSLMRAHEVQSELNEKLKKY